MSGRFSNCSRTKGLTLVEVLAAVALLCGLLVGIMVAFDKHARQITRADERLEAYRHLDELLYQWSEGGTGMPAEGHGELPDAEDLSWRTRVVSTRNRDSLGVDVIRLTVVSSKEGATAEPLIELELAVPSPHWPPQDGQTQ